VPVPRIHEIVITLRVVLVPRTGYIVLTSLTEGRLRRRSVGGAGCGPCGLGSQPSTRAASGPARRPLRAGCEELADAGRCAGPMKRGPRSEKCRGGAPRGAPAGVIGRLVSFARETGPIARRATGTAFRASAYRRSAPLGSGAKGKTASPAPPRIGAAKL